MLCPVYFLTIADAVKDGAGLEFNVCATLAEGIFLGAAGQQMTLTRRFEALDWDLFLASSVSSLLL